MSTPLVSIMIATFNSSKLLPRTLEAIKNQSYPQDKIEILIIDGGSIDSTLDIAKDYGCRILNNDKTEPLNAKKIGFLEAKGQYLVTIDHDEVMVNPDSIKLKVEALQNNPECKVALCSGYKRPDDYPLLNEYISEFGDPFSLFMYGFPKGYESFGRSLKKYYELENKNEFYFIADFSKSRRAIIMEIVCLATMLDLEYFRSVLNVKDDTSSLIQAFYIMLENGFTKCVYIKNDPLVHYSADSLKAYFPKLKWRICNNIHFTDMASGGFNGRLNYQKNVRCKKFLFVPYTVLTIVPFLHGFLLSLSRKNPIYLMHPVFCWYVLCQIVWQYFLKIIGRKPALKSYDGKKKISGKD